MGNCNSDRDREDQPVVVVRDKGRKEDVLTIVRLKLKELENEIINLRKEDVHFRMTRLIFLLNCINELIPIIKDIEDGNDLEYFMLRDCFDEVFDGINLNDRKKYARHYSELKRILTEGYIADINGNNQYNSNMNNNNNNLAQGGNNITPVK